VYVKASDGHFEHYTTGFKVLLIPTTNNVSDDINSYVLIFPSVSLNYVYFEVAMSASIFFYNIK